MQKSALVMLMVGLTVSFTSQPVSAQVSGELFIVNQTESLICEVYITPSESDFDDADDPLELLSFNGLDCIEPDDGANISYEVSGDCYAIVELYDENGNFWYSNGVELCTRNHIVISNEDLAE